MLYTPGAGTPFIFAIFFLWVDDLNTDNAYFYCLIACGSYSPGPGY